MQSREIKSWLRSYEKLWGENPKILPHFKYFTRPLYKQLGGDEYPWFSVPVTFAVADFIMHQLVSHFVEDYLAGQLSANTLLKFSPMHTLVWILFSLPIAYYKQTKLSDTPSPFHLSEMMECRDTIFAAGQRVLTSKRKKSDRVISDAEMAASCFGGKPRTTP